MGVTWRANDDGTARAVECEEFVEVVYEDDTVLVVNLATSIAKDEAFTDALVDAIATNELRPDVESAIGVLANRFGMDVHPIDGGGQRALTIAPPERTPSKGA